MTRLRPALLLAGIPAILACHGTESSPRTPSPLPVDPDPLEQQDSLAHIEAAWVAADEASGLRYDVAWLDLGTESALDAAEAPESAADAVEADAAFTIDPGHFDLAVTVRPEVEVWIDFFHNRIPDRFGTYLSRMGRFEPLIRENLRQRGMPQDLIYLALIESGFSPVAYSHAHAAGVWQFIAPTARRYGLEVSFYLDERYDPIRATDAALDYLEDLHRRFGSWYLAAAGYNTGENRVERLLRQHAGGRRGDDALFWTIAHALPRETREYVPKILAAAIVGRYAVHYGFGDVATEPPKLFDTVTVPDATDLDVVARAAGVEEREIRGLNPQFRRGMTPPGRSVQVRVPPGTATAFNEAYPRIPADQRVRFIEHLVQRGETLSHIARRYGSSVAAVQQANNIRDPRRIQIGQRIIIPRGAAQAVRAQAAAQSAAPAPAGGVHVVRSGDSLWTISRRYGVTVAQLRQWNGLSSDVIRPGQRLRVTRP